MIVLSGLVETQLGFVSDGFVKLSMTDLFSKSDDFLLPASLCQTVVKFQDASSVVTGEHIPKFTVALHNSAASTIVQCAEKHQNHFKKDQRSVSN